MTHESYNIVDKYEEQRQVAEFHNRTLDTEIYAHMMTMTSEEIIGFMGIQPEHVTERLRIFIDETLAIHERRKVAEVQQPEYVAGFIELREQVAINIAAETATVHKFGLDLGQKDFDELGVELETINDAERQAWREGRGTIIGANALTVVRVGAHAESDEMQLHEGER